jgi:hypothetical protein
MLITSVVGCSQEPQPATTAARGALSVPKLPFGSSLASAEETVGSLRVLTDEGNSEQVAAVGRWQLRFQGDRLQQKRHTTTAKRTRLPHKVLDQLILWRLRPSETRANVEQILGMPEVRENVYEAGVPRYEIFRYAYWELEIVDGRLVRRTRQ